MQRSKTKFKSHLSILIFLIPGFLLSTGFSTSLYAGVFPLIKVGELGSGPSVSLDVQDDYLYQISHNNLTVIDIRVPTEPLKVGFSPLRHISPRDPGQG